jgi:RNA polymerase sigma factor (sigma-70 family)
LLSDAPPCFAVEVSRTLSPFTAELVALAETAESLEAFRLELLERLRRVVAFDGAMLNPGARDGEPHPEPTCLDHERDCFQKFITGGATLRRETRRLSQACRAGRVVVDSEIYSAADQSRMTFYQDFIRPSGFGSLLLCPLTFRGELEGVITMVRSPNLSLFSRDDAERIQELLPLAALADIAVRQRLETERAAPEEPEQPGQPEQPEQPEQKVEKEERGDLRAVFEALSPREKQVAVLIGRGLQAKEIAGVLGTSPNTVRKQSNAIYQKLGMRGRTEVAITLRRIGGVKDPFRA